MSKPPAFQFYAKDFMDSTRFWDANACGLYIRCLCIQWEHGGIPSDLKTLARGVGMDTSEVESLWQTVGQKFEQGDDGLLINRRLEAVRSRQEEVSEKRRNAAKARWDADANASTNAHAKPVQRKEKEKEEGDDTSSAGEEKEKEEEGVQREGALTVEIWPTFDDWWSLYDKKTGRAPCEAKWKRLKQDEKEAIMRHTEAYVAATPEIQYRKNPLTYLNQKSWNDEHVTRRDDPARPVTAKLERIQRMLAEREHRGAIPQARALGYADGERSE